MKYVHTIFKYFTFNLVHMAMFTSSIDLILINSLFVLVNNSSLEWISLENFKKILNS